MLLAAKDIPDLQFHSNEPEEKGESAVRTEVMEIMDVDTKERVKIHRNSNSQEHSRNSLESAASGASDQVNQQRSMEKMIDPEPHNRISEYRELSQKLRSSKKVAGEETSRKLVHQTLNKGTDPEHSKNREHSQNSWKKQAGVDRGNVNIEHSQNSLLNGEPKVDKGEVNVLFSDCDSQRIPRTFFKLAGGG